MTFLPVELTALGPLWWVIGGALTLLFLEMFLKERGRDVLPVVAMTFLVLAIGSDFNLLTHSQSLGVFFNRSVVVDLYSVTLGAICLLSALLGVLFSAAYLKREKAVTGEYYALILLASAGMVVLVSAAEFLTLFVGLELMSLAGYILAGYLRIRERSTEAAVKYFLNGVFSSAFLLYGIAIFYGLTGTLYFSDLQVFIQHQITTAPTGSDPMALVSLGVAFLLVGLGFKVALVPFHAWAADVYDGAPAPVSAFLSTGVKAAAFGVFVRLFAEVFAFPGSWTAAFCVLAVITMTLGNLSALAQTNFKRLLAYSSVAHAGYLSIGLAALVGNPANTVERAVAFYLLAYTLMTAGVFGWIAWASGEGESHRAIEDYRGLGYSRPWMSIALSLFLFSLAGMTPTAGFFGKYFLFKLAVDNGMTWLAIVAVLNSFISAYYYLKVVTILYAKPATGAKPVLLRLSVGLSFAFFLCAVGVVIAGFLKFPF